MTDKETYNPDDKFKGTTDADLLKKASEFAKKVKEKKNVDRDE